MNKNIYSNTKNQKNIFQVYKNPYINIKKIIKNNKKQSNEEIEFEKEIYLTKEINENKLIQKSINYKLDPKLIPHPNEYEDIYKNNQNENYYKTEINTLTPNSTSNYIIKEIENSSCRFIRSSLIKIPINQNILNNSNLPFGIYCQPFAEIQEKENKIPIIKNKNGILKCKKCNCYINNNFKITFNKLRDQIIICNFCNYENILNNETIGFKQEYIIGNPIENCKELKYPTIDFLINENIKDLNLKDFIPHYLFCIDISNISLKINFCIYILNSISNFLNNFHNCNNSFIGFCTYNIKGIEYYFLGKNKDFNIVKMNDLKNPFCPISSNKIFYNVINQQKDILILIEKIIYYLEIKKEKEQNLNDNNYNIPEILIYSVIESLNKNGGRILLFNCSSSNFSFDKTKFEYEKKYFNQEKEFNLFIPKHDLFSFLIDKCIKYRISIDQFIFGDIIYDLKTFSILSNLTGGNIKLYDFNIKEINNKKNFLNSYFEKLYHDIYRIISRPNYYDIKVNLKYSIGIKIMEIFGPINKKLSDNFIIPSFNPDTSFFYDLRINDSFKNNQKINFQLIVFYTDNFNQRFLRIFNYSIKTCDNISQIYSFCDIDTLTKLFFIKELNFIYKKPIKEIRENLINKLTNIFYYYKKETNNNNLGQLILPPQIKYLPCFLNSLFKKEIFITNKNNISPLKINYLINFYINCPLYSFILHLYPKMYKINLDKLNTINNKKRLSLEIIKLNRAYLILNGEFLDFFIFNKEKKEFYKLLFGKDDFISCRIDNVYNLNEIDLNNEIGEYLNNFIENKKYENFGNYMPLRLFFLNQNSCLKNDNFKMNFIEDSFYDEISYSDFLMSLHKKIEQKFKK